MAAAVNDGTIVVDDVLALRMLRDYILPVLVWLWMVRFLCKSAIIPVFQSGVWRQLRRGDAAPPPLTNDDEDSR